MCHLSNSDISSAPIKSHWDISHLVQLFVLLFLRQGPRCLRNIKEMFELKADDQNYWSLYTNQQAAGKSNTIATEEERI